MNPVDWVITEIDDAENAEQIENVLLNLPADFAIP